MIDEVARKAIAEALIFAAEEPVPLRLLAEILEIPPPDAEAVLESIRADYEQPGRGLRLVEAAGGFRFTTRPDYHPWVKILFRNQRTVRLSRAALQILAIIAYKQPVTGPEIEDIRGVDASGVLKNLLDKHLIKILGRKEVVGRPILYGTTKEFLIQFGLKGLDDLPSLEEFADLLRADLASGEAADVLDTVDGGDAPGPGATTRDDHGHDASTTVAEAVATAPLAPDPGTGREPDAEPKAEPKAEPGPDREGA